MFGFGTLEIIIILIVVVCLIGPGRTRTLVRRVVENGKQFNRLRSALRDPLSLLGKDKEPR